MVAEIPVKGLDRDMQTYLDLLNYVLEHGESHDDRTGVGTLSVFGYQLRFDLQRGFPLLTTKKLPFRWIAEELFWFLSGSTDEHKLRARGVDIWQEWATEEQCAKFNRAPGDLGPVYGFLWRHFGGAYIDKQTLETTQLTSASARGVDQISKLLTDMAEKPNSRRLIVTGWHPAHADLVELPPCHTLFQFKIHADNSLSCHLYARSIDAFLGLPFNIASYALLTELIAHVTLRKTRHLIISFGDLHIYKTHLGAVREQLQRSPVTLPRLSVNTTMAANPLTHLMALSYEDLELLDYRPQGKISAPVAV